MSSGLSQLFTTVVDLLLGELVYSVFLPERDYVTFGSLLSPIRLSSVTFVRPTQGVETFGNVSSPCCTLSVL